MTHQHKMLICSVCQFEVGEVFLTGFGVCIPSTKYMKQRWKLPRQHQSCRLLISSTDAFERFSGTFMKLLMEEILHRLRLVGGSLSHYLQGFIHPNGGWSWDL